MSAEVCVPCVRLRFSPPTVIINGHSQETQSVCACRRVEAETNQRSQTANSGLMCMLSTFRGGLERVEVVNHQVAATGLDQIIPAK